QVREAQVDGHPTALLLLEPVRIDRRQGFDQRRFAMVDMTGGADDEGAGNRLRHDIEPATASITASSSPGSTVRGSSSTRSSTIRPMTAGSCARRRASKSVAPPWRGVMATTEVGSRSPGNDPPPTVDSAAATATAT